MKYENGVILIIEDEENLGKTLLEFLNGIGFNCHLAQNAKCAKELFHSIRPTIVLMDIGLPDQSGLELAKEFKEIRNDFVLLFLSALNDPDIRVQGLEIGAEDYITKPFALKELTMRLERILKSQMLEHDKNNIDQHSHELIIGDLTIWFKRYQVKNAYGTIQNLTKKEGAILKYLYDHQTHVVTRDELISNIWGDNKFPTNRTIDNYIVTLRKWSETSKNKSIELLSVRGLGYKIIIND